MKSELKELFTSYWKYLAINAACELLLFDKLELKEYNIEKLCEENSWHFESLKSLIDFCIAEGYIEANIYLRNTEKGKLLVSHNPNGLYFACLHWADEHLTSWQNLSHTIKTGKSTFSNIYGKTYFDYLNKNTDRLLFYQKAMGEYARDDYNGIAKKLEFSDNDSVLDVGGGSGMLIREIKNDRPLIRCGIFDLKKVIASNKYENIESFTGNFFEEIPKGFNNLILSRVIHDWDKINSLKILHNCNKALKAYDKIFLIENLTDKMEHTPHLLTLNMKLVCESQERSSLEYENMLTETGFEIVSITQLNLFQYIITAIKK